MKIKEIFIGSSSEAFDQAKQIADLFRGVDGIQTTLWKEAFELSDLTFEGIKKIAERVAGAVFLATPDDEATIKGQTVRVPRANVMFEFGYLTAVLGRGRVALCRYDETELPSDFHDLTRAELGKFEPHGGLGSNPLELGRLRDWASKLRQRPDPVEAIAELTKGPVYVLRHAAEIQDYRQPSFFAQALAACHPKIKKDVNSVWEKAADYLCRYLCSRGLLVEDPGKKRGMRITDLGKALLAEDQTQDRFRRIFEQGLLAGFKRGVTGLDD